jgi:hypothetical protein
MVEPTCNISTYKAEAGGSWFRVRLGSIVRSRFTPKTIIKKWNVKIPKVYVILFCKLSLGNVFLNLKLPWESPSLFKKWGKGCSSGTHTPTAHHT